VDLALRPMHLHLLPRCALLLLAVLAGPTEALETSDVDVAARLGMQEPIAKPLSAPVTETERRADGGHSPFVQARWWARPETWGSGYRWSLTNGSLVNGLTEETHHSARVARGYRGLNSGLTEDHRLALFEGAARFSPQKLFIDRIDVGWTPSPSGDLLPRQVWELRRGESDPLVLRLRRGVLTVVAQRTF
jgi:hypothetical protein